jgi:predicted nuclease of predicted toxin-antitoxin system
MRILLDVHVSSRYLGRPLIEQGHDVHALDVDERNRELVDVELLELAAAERRILITHNVKDFAPELRRRQEAGAHHDGCILVTLPHTAYGEILRQLEVLFAVIPRAADWRDRAVWISRSTTKY